MAKKGFWCMVWSGNGVTYTELMQMDLAEYSECCEAKRLWFSEWKPKKQPVPHKPGAAAFIFKRQIRNRLGI